jgi:hypothetical protein
MTSAPVKVDDLRSATVTPAAVTGARYSETPGGDHALRLGERPGDVSCRIEAVAYFLSRATGGSIASGARQIGHPCDYQP